MITRTNIRISSNTKTITKWITSNTVNKTVNPNIIKIINNSKITKNQMEINLLNKGTVKFNRVTNHDNKDKNFKTQVLAILSSYDYY